MASVDVADTFDYADDDKPRGYSAREDMPNNYRHAVLRGAYGKLCEKSEDDNLVGLGSLINGSLIEVRGRDLAPLLQRGDYNDAVRAYLETGSLNQAVKKCSYLRDDYKIYPEIARRMFSYAISLVDLDKLKKEIERLPLKRRGFRKRKAKTETREE